MLKPRLIVERDIFRVDCNNYEHEIFLKNCTKANVIVAHTKGK